MWDSCCVKMSLSSQLKNWTLTALDSSLPELESEAHLKFQGNEYTQWGGSSYFRTMKHNQYWVHETINLDTFLSVFQWSLIDYLTKQFGLL